MQKRNVLSKSFLFVCRLFYFSNFSITHVCVFVFLSQTRICRVYSNARVPPSSIPPSGAKNLPPHRAQVPYLLNTPSTAAFHPAYFFSRISSSIFGSYTLRFIFPASFSRSYTPAENTRPYKPLQSRKAPPRPEYLRVYSYITLELHQISVSCRAAVYTEFLDPHAGILLHRTDKVGDLVGNAIECRFYHLSFSCGAGNSADRCRCFLIPVRRAKPGKCRNQIRAVCRICLPLPVLPSLLPKKSASGHPSAR